jgi:hypothetical protein
MSAETRQSRIRDRDLRGSRLRCLLLTSQPRSQVAGFLTSLAAPHAEVSAGDNWSPRGFWEPEEARLGETRDFLAEEDRKALTTWWLSNPIRANTPNWDLVSTCRIADRAGLLLVEGKAHLGEFADDSCTATNSDNLSQIKTALREAMTGWDRLGHACMLSASSHYQLSNRFAFAWKLATMGTPVVLIYLGFIDAHDMQNRGRRLITSDSQWRDWVVKRSKKTVPLEVWDKTINVDGTQLTVLIRSALVGVHARVMTAEPSTHVASVT